MSEISKSTSVLARLALFAAAMIWGSSFFIVKNATDSIPPNYLLALRFTIAFLLLCVIFVKKLKQINRDYLIRGAVIGLFLFSGYSMQTIGITDTTPGKNAFLTAVYCVIVPFLFWIVSKKRPDKYNFFAAVLCLTGIGFVSLTESFSICFGDLLTLLGGLIFAMHIVAVSLLTKDRDPVLITILQFGYSAVFSWIVTLCFERPLPASMSSNTIWAILFLAVFATAVALLLQNVGQKYTHPAAASIILCLESVFGVLFSVIFYGETLTPRLVFGFILIFVAIIISETKLSFIKSLKNFT